MKRWITEYQLTPIVKRKVGKLDFSEFRKKERDREIRYMLTISAVLAVMVTTISLLFTIANLGI